MGCLARGTIFSDEFGLAFNVSLRSGYLVQRSIFIAGYDIIVRFLARMVQRSIFLLVAIFSQVATFI